MHIHSSFYIVQSTANDMKKHLDEDSHDPVRVVTYCVLYQNAVDTPYIPNENSIYCPPKIVI